MPITWMPVERDEWVSSCDTWHVYEDEGGWHGTDWTSSHRPKWSGALSSADEAKAWCEDRAAKRGAA